MPSATPRAAIYARYSDEKQQDRSVDDQIAICRAYCAQKGYEVAAVFADRARSSMERDRPELHAMMDGVEAGRFDVVVAEKPDRISRDPEHNFGLFKRMEHHGVHLDTPSDGVANAIMTLIRSLTGHIFYADLSTRVSDRMREQAKQGRFYTKAAYGFRNVPGEKGRKEIVPEEAEVVRRICRDYLAGSSPRVIAQRLNAEGIPGPGGTPWQAQNIHQGGTVAGAKGILANPIYTGRFQWGRQRCARHPVTGRSIMKKAEREAVVTHLPELQIVDDATWAAVQREREARALGSGHRGPRGSGLEPPQVRSQYLLSGLVYCPCGARMICNQNDSYGPRIVCSDAHAERGCPIRRSYALWRLEKAVVDRLVEKLSDLEGMKIAIRQYNEDREKQQGEAKKEAKAIRKRLAEIDAHIEKLIGLGPVEGRAGEKIRQRLDELSQEDAGLRQRLEIASRTVERLEVSPDHIARYAAALRVVQRDLLSGQRTAKIREVVRSLIDRITVYPVPRYAPLDFEVEGKARTLLGFDPDPPARSADSLVCDKSYLSFPKRTLSQTAIPLGRYRSAA